MLPDRVSNPGPLTYESGALPIAPRGPAGNKHKENTQETGHILLPFLFYLYYYYYHYYYHYLPVTGGNA